MSQGQGRSMSENVDRPTGTRRRRRFFRRPIEKKNPGNVEFERQVAAIEARQEQARMRFLFAILGWDHITDESGEDDNQVAPNDHPKGSSGLASKEPKQQKENSNSDFLEGTFLKISSDKQKVMTNKKNSKNKKKKKGKSRKRYHASEMQSELCTGSSSACANAGTSGENLSFSSSYVAIDVPLFDYSSSSPSSRVIELISPVSSVSSSNDKELSSNSNDFRSFSTSSYYSVPSSPVNDCSSGSNASVTNESYAVSNACNNTGGDDAGSLSDVRTEWSWSATGLTDDYQGFNKWSGNRNKQNDHESFSVTISHSSSSQESSLCGGCGDDGSHDGEFQKVISRKTAQKMKRIQCLQSPTPTISSSLPISGALVPRARSEITIGHYINDDCFSGRKPNHKKGKYQKGRGLGSAPKTGFTAEQNVPGQSRMFDITVHPGNLESSQMALSSTSHRVALEVIEENCSSGCVPLPSQGELKDLAPVDPGGAKDTDSGAAISDKASSLEYRVHVGSSSTIDCEEQKKEQNEHALSSHESQFDKIIKAVTNAYEIQAADSNCSHPVADIENFIQSATPVIGQVPCTTSNNSCMLDQEVHNQMQNVALRSVWRWYEEPESFGIEVERQRGINCHPSGTYSWSKLCAYFVPSLSAVQLFGKSPNDGGLLFEHFEREKPFLRPPLFTKIKQLVSGENPSGNPMFGDPKQLDSVKLSDLHPASWFCVAWYPIYQIPSALRSCQASFLTYHSLGKLVPKKCSKDVAGGLTAIICPIVGLLSLKCHGEKWFHQGEKKLGSKPTTGGSLEITDPAEHLNLRLEALKHSASAMSKAVMPRATGEFMNYHQDYMFFSTRAF